MRKILPIGFYLQEVKRPAGTTGCWLWPGRRHSDGYGMYGQKRAHRVVFELTHGPLTREQIVLHSCDVKCCVNPAHLSVGTHSDNMRDAGRKGHLAGWSRRSITGKYRELVLNFPGTWAETCISLGISYSTVAKIHRIERRRLEVNANLNALQIS
jgi:HNH endonuclease